MRILLISDVHLDAPFKWADAKTARKRRQAVRDALIRAMDLAMQERVDAICFGGDLFEHEYASSDTGAFLRAQMERVDPIRVFIAPGNHDWLGPQSLYRQVRWSPNIHIFQDSRLTPTSLTDGLTLWGAAHSKPAGTPNFLEGFAVDRGGIHLALFHGSVQGPLPAQHHIGMVHAPFRASEIEACGLHFALLGHYHVPRDHERFTYPGNPEPLEFGESDPQGIARGVVLAAVDAGGRVNIDRHGVAVSHVHDLKIDLSGCASRQEARERVAFALIGRCGCARLNLCGELAPEVNLSPVDFEGVGDLDARVVRFDGVCVAYDLEAIAREPTVRGRFVRDVGAAADLSDDQRRRVIITGLRALDGRGDLEVF